MARSGAAVPSGVKAASKSNAAPRVKSLLGPRSGFVLIALILVIWQLLVSQGIVRYISLPAPADVIAVWFRLISSGRIFDSLLPSAWRLAVGFGLSAMLAIPLGVLMGAYEGVANLFGPLVQVLRPLPSVTIVPIAVLFFGIDDLMKISVIVFGCFFPILLNTYNGVRGIEPVLVATARNFGLSPAKVLMRVIVIGSAPYVFTGLRVSLGIGIIMVVVGEMVVGNSGVGYALVDAQRSFRVPETYAWIFTVGALGYLLDYALQRVERRLLRWHFESHGMGK